MSRTGSPLGAPGKQQKLKPYENIQNKKEKGTKGGQGFRNKVFVIGIPRELGRSSFKKERVAKPNGELP